MRDGAKTLVEPHRLNRVYIWKGVQGALLIKSFAPSERVYNEKESQSKITQRIKPNLEFGIHINQKL